VTINEENDEYSEENEAVPSNNNDDVQINHDVIFDEYLKMMQVIINQEKQDVKKEELFDHSKLNTYFIQRVFIHVKNDLEKDEKKLQ